MQQNILNFLWIFPKRCIQIEVIFFCQCLQDRICKRSRLLTALPPQHGNRALVDAQRAIGNHQVRIKFHLISESVALRTCPERVVERKASGLDFINADTAVRARKALGKRQHFLIASHAFYKQKSLRQVQDIFDRIRQSAFDSRLHNQTVNDDFDIMLDILIQLDILRQLIQIAVNADSHIAASRRAFQHLLMPSLSSAHNGRKQLQPRSFRKCHDLIHHLIDALFLDLLAAVRAMRNADSRIQQTEIVINLCYCSDSRTRVTVRRFLINRNRRRKSFDLFHIRLLHLS